MVQRNTSKPELMGYITGLTQAIKNSLIPDSTGLYGYINGEFMDGIGWDPGEGYDPTEREWYKAALAAKGEIVLVDPYVDEYTGNSMISVAKALSDGKSVVALDLTIDELQNIMQEHVEEKGIFAEFIINARQVVVAHSDQSLVGTDYSDESNPLGKKIAEARRQSDDNFFYLDYMGGRYLVYGEPLMYGWTCVTVIDATKEYQNLKIPLFISILTAIVIISVMAFFLRQSDKKSREAYEMAIISEKATAASEAKSNFLSNMSHEIRTPINAILGMNEMILRESDDQEVLNYSENIKNAGKTLIGLINDILDFSKIEARKIEINPVNYDLASVLNDLVVMISSRADDKGLELILDFDKNLPIKMNGDEVRIKQIITNILTNAVKYTKKGGVTFSVGYERIYNEPDQVMLKVAITDTGIGIKEEDIKRLFIEFERIEEKRNRNIEGTGLGMTITRSLLEMMGSSLCVKSEYGKGSTFSFTLKQKVINWDPLGDYEDRFKELRECHSRYKERLVAKEAHILAVDDNPLNIMVIKSLLKETEIIIDTAENGDKGINLAAKNKYDVILMDHMMPGKDGIETMHEIKSLPDSLNAKTPVICVTANAISGAKEEYLEEGFDDYLTKPIDSEKLEELLIRYLPRDKVKMVNINDVPEDVEDPKIHEEIEALRDQDMIDIEKGLQISGSPEAYIPILKICYDFADDWIYNLNECFKNGNLSEYTTRVHAIKSSLKTIGATELSDEAQKLENAGKEFDTVYINAHHDDFIDRCRYIKTILNKAFKKSGDPYEGMPLADDTLLSVVYESIRKAAADMDCNALESIFEEMEDYRIPDKDRELFKKLKKAEERFDYDEIIMLLS
jgi:signal transduction histidine kinase/CheY-like chemotaxis protein